MNKHFLSVSILVLGLLGACTQTPTPVSISVPSSGEISTVTLGLNDNKDSGQLRPATVFAVGSITLTPPSTYSNVDNGTSIDIAGTFTVQANRAFSNITLYAIGRSTNLGGTALNRVFNFGNTEITNPAFAQKVKPIHGMTNSTTVNPNKADMQFFQIAEAAAAQQQARAAGIIGSTDEILEYGYVARRCTANCATATPTWTRVFANGDIGEITLAIRVPKGSSAAEDPYRFFMSFLVADEPTMRFTRSIEEGVANFTNVAARATAFAGSGTKEIFVRGGPGGTVSTACTGCVAIRADNIRTSSAPTFMVTPTTSASVSGTMYLPYVTSNTPQSLGIATEARFVIGQAIVKFKPLPFDGVLRPLSVLNQQPLFENTSLVTSSSIPPRAGIASIQASTPDAQSTLDFIAQLRTRADVEYAQPNYLYKHTLTPNDPKYPVQSPANTPNNFWHYSMANIPTAWDITTGDSSVVVAILDTGILYNKADYIGLDVNNTKEASTHEDLYCGSGATNRWLPGFDFVSYASSVEANTFDDDDPYDLGPYADTSLHGTHVAGTIGACSNNNLGIAGINWSSRMMAVRVLGPSGGSTSDITRAMRWAAGLPVTVNTGSGNTSITNPNPADILNMSLGGAGVDQAYQDAADDVNTAGKVLVVAAGNDNDNAYGYAPAGQRNVLTVAALGPGVKRAYYSNYGSAVEIAAPGGDFNSATTPNGVLSTLGCNANGQTPPDPTTGCGAAPWGYTEYQGTSMATPHIVGIIGLMNAARVANSLPKLNLQQATFYLQSTATPIPAGSGCDSGCGAGAVNAVAAIAAAISNNPIGAFLQLEYNASGTTTNPGLDFGASTTTGTMTLRNLSSTAGTYTLSGSNAFISGDVSGSATGNIAGNSSVTINVNLNRTGLADGSYIGSIQASTGTQNTFAPVYYRQGAGTVDAGRAYIALLQLNNAATAYTTAGRQVMKWVPEQGYKFRFNSTVPTGNYAIETVIDADQNGTGEYYVCHPVPIGYSCQTNTTLYTFPVTTTAITREITIGAIPINLGTFRY